MQQKNEGNFLFYILIALILIVFAISFTIELRAETLQGFHNQHHHGRLHHWYQKLMRPDVPKISCCSSNDCTPTQARQVNGKWQAMKAGRWIDIPSQKINAEESVDTQAHICWYPFTKETDDILCFVKPGNGI